MSDLRIFVDPAALLLGEGGREEWPDARHMDIALGGDTILGKALPVIVSGDLVTAVRSALDGHKFKWLTTLAADPVFYAGVVDALGWPGMETVCFRNLAHETDPLGIDLWLPRTVAASVHPGDAVLWVSADAALYAGWLQSELPSTDILNISPDPERGLTRGHIAVISAFVATHRVN